jgi:Co/Zn/Cd efflux system component
MSAECCAAPSPKAGAIPPKYRRALWIALAVNLSMFLVEVGAGWSSGSVALLADAVDFFGDAGNYALSLFVLSMGLAARARAPLFKGACMAAYGMYVLVQASWNAWQGVTPEATTMGAVGLLALVANLSVAALLYAWREGDANMRSVWLCTRNDVIGNLAILLAALGVFGTGRAWPDLVVASVMASLALTASRDVIVRARTELSTFGGLRAHS